MIGILLNDTAYEQDIRELLMAFYPGETFVHEKQDDVDFYVEGTCTQNADETKFGLKITDPAGTVTDETVFPIDYDVRLNAKTTIKKELYGKKLFNMFYLIPMFFTGGLIPTYMVVKNLGLTDTMTVMVLPFSVVTYYIIVGRTFFENSIPDELWEAAQLDGCGYISFFFKICLPLSKAIIAVIALWAAVGQWNGYFNALIYLRSEALQPLQIVLRNILISNQTISSMMTGSAAVEAKQMADLIKYAVIVVSSAPIMCMYPFVQKYFNQGVMLGAVKG